MSVPVPMPRRRTLPWTLFVISITVALATGVAWLTPVVSAGGLLLVAGPATPAEVGAASAGDVARGHGVAHDGRAMAAITRWMALGQPSGIPAPATPAAAQDVPDQVITVRTTGSNLEFVPAKLSAKAGTRVRVDYINEGLLPHNFVIIRNEDDLDALGAAAYDAEATGFVPLEQRDKLIAYTALASPGTTVSVTFEVPAAGEYTFVCLFPGHYNVMLGTFRALN